MLFILSPAKTLDGNPPKPAMPPTQPEFLKEAEALVKILRKKSAAQLGRLMDISPKLAELNHARYQRFSTPFTTENAQAALTLFKGDVYQGMEVKDYGKKDWAFAQAHGRILSGLYGLLRPLDLMQPYRLEMGTALASPKGENLYDFWKKAVTAKLASELGDAKQHPEPVLLNLASQEYAGAVDAKALAKKGIRVIEVQFKEEKNGKLATIGLLAKRARGMMANHIIRGQINEPEALKRFTEGGYRFRKELSDEAHMIFTRKAGKS
ncbi:peroxide stress protein YaaA [bacterium]|nr:peroxide stress protein YaaA [bacterium]